MTPWVGTSGFQYAEWKGKFYPEDLSTAKMLAFYAQQFSTTEINYTFHRIPAAKTIENWKLQTPPNFRFGLKAPQKVTHFARLRDCSDTMRYFHDVTSGLGEKLGPILFQLPPNFKKDIVLLADFVNRTPKDFGYDPTIVNQGDVLPIDAPPIRKCAPGEEITVDISSSHFSRCKR